MTTSAAASAPGTLSRTGSVSATATRRLAWVCAVGSAVTVVVALLPVPALSFDNDHPPLWATLLLAVLHLPQLAGVLALGASGAAGRWWPARAGIVVAAVGCLVFVAGELLYPVDLNASDTAFTVATFAGGIGLAAAGIAVLVRRQWPVVTRWLPLGVGLYLFVVLTPALIAGTGELYALAGWSLLWTALGAALLVTLRSGPRR